MAYGNSVLVRYVLYEQLISVGCVNAVMRSVSNNRVCRVSSLSIRYFVRSVSI